MSKGKRAAQAEMTPAPKLKKGLFRNERGGLRAGWLLALSLLAWTAVSLAVRYGLLAVFNAVFRAWGIDAENAHLAPGWARMIYAWHGSIITALSAAAAIGLSRVLMRLWSVNSENMRFSGRCFARSWLAGLAIVAGIAALCLLPDSMRPEWPLSRPRGDSALPALCLISLLGVTAEEVFTKGVICAGVRSRWGAGWAVLCACVASLLVGGMPLSVPAAANASLLALACCLLYARRGLWSAIGFRWGWSLANVFLWGFGGGRHAVYRLYGVSENWLTGGDAGFIGGLWAVLVLSALIAWLARGRITSVLRNARSKRKKRQGAD